MDQPQNIKKLDQAVINKIAAGEIIQRPFNALKELIENSLDAKSTNIQITLKDGGLKLLQIQDNGIGIRKEDFEVVCDRFTTSKLEKFEDLSSLSTYGFRGEALASISHIAHLSITSKTSNELCAYKASFVNGKLQETPKPIAGNQGTIITVEDMFYNMHVRQKALKSPTEEYRRILEVVIKYAVHNSKVGFSVRKSGGNNDIRTPPQSKTVENIRNLYGNSVARELIEFSSESESLGFKANGYITNVNYSSKLMAFLLFINHRLVDCQILKRCIHQVYKTYLPKNSYPFVYISLEINPSYVDVNVHPTKHEVRFLNEEQIVETITTELERKLLGSNNSRVFYIQTKLPGAQTSEIEDPNMTKKSKIHPKYMVRTDHRAQKLDKFFGAPIEKSSRIDDASLSGELHTGEILEKSVMENPAQTMKITNTSRNKMNRYETRLTSVLELRISIEDNCHMALRETFAKHVFVGAIDPSKALIQYKTKLYFCNTKIIFQELSYQFVIYNFQNLGLINLGEPLSLYDLALMGLNLSEIGWTPENGPKEELAQKIVDILIDKRAMLNDYFSLEIDKDGKLRSLPMLFDNYVPEISGLPVYIVRLATQVSWDEEKNCFHTFAQETAKYYSQVTINSKYGNNNWKWITEHVIYASIKAYFIPSKDYTSNGAILELTNLPYLYKKFERC